MAYETPKSAKTETFVEKVSPIPLHTGAAPMTWTRIDAPHKVDRGGVVFVVSTKMKAAAANLMISFDGTTPGCTVSSDIYLPIQFPFWIQGGPATNATILLLNYTLGGSNLRG